MGSSEVRFEKGLVTIKANNAVLIEILAQVSNTARIPISYEAVDPTQRVTVAIKNTPADMALREILAGYDYFFLFASAQEKLQAAWIYPADKGRTVALTDAESAFAEASEYGLYSTDSATRVLALQQYTAVNAEDAGPRIQEALKDEEVDVRAMAIMSATNNAIDIPLEFLTEMAVRDPSPTVRSMALNSLSMNPEIGLTTLSEIVEMALDDPNELLREQAEAILQGLEKSEHSDSEHPLWESFEDEETA